MELANVEEQYEKFPKLNREDVRYLFEWMESQSHLPSITELKMMLFLHSNYGHIEETKKTIEVFYDMRSRVKVFQDRDILREDLKLFRSLFVFAPLPQATKEGHRIIMGKFIDCDSSKFVMNSFVSQFALVAEAFLLEEGLHEGHVIVFDVTGVNMGHVTRLGFFALRNIFRYLQEALPFRLKGFHLINVIPVIDKIIFLMRPFVRKEFWDVFNLHTTMDTVYNYIDPEILPSNYAGGKAPSFEEYHDTYYKHLEGLREYLMTEN